MHMLCYTVKCLIVNNVRSTCKSDIFNMEMDIQIPSWV